MERTYWRNFRRDCYKIFADDAQKNFAQIAQHDPNHKSLYDLYSFHVVPGGRQGGHQDEVVELFYGTRPYDATTELAANARELPRLRKRLLAESGATLLYERVDNGSVLVTLYPARSERFSRKEDMILLSRIRNPQKLTDFPSLRVIGARSTPTWNTRALMACPPCRTDSAYGGYYLPELS